MNPPTVNANLIVVLNTDSRTELSSVGRTFDAIRVPIGFL